jgi:hypothetical protein
LVEAGLKGPFIDKGWEGVAKETSTIGVEERPELLGQCVSLVARKGGSGVPPTAKWRPGARVLDTKHGNIPKRTVIATFWCERYPSKFAGNHAALYIGHSDKHIEVVEQWAKKIYKTDDKGKEVRDDKGNRVVERTEYTTPVKAGEVRKEGIKANKDLYTSAKSQATSCVPGEKFPDNKGMSNIADYYHVVLATE